MQGSLRPDGRTVRRGADGPEQTGRQVLQVWPRPVYEQVPEGLDCHPQKPLQTAARQTAKEKEAQEMMDMSSIVSRAS